MNLIIQTEQAQLTDDNETNRTSGACVASEALFVFFAFHPATLHFYRH
ncbi:hypothetical protein LRU_02325 [Ligilactobacillus ruminis SPM0211]|uniref:Uncharacterized protein n=1 Tax=Ligilactobacillus ruminis SPM0211 TaxID=1040964 RepID=F7R3R4_9LACO|nr:hypothetical protein LRU_02325 [Ligilactobacillus ruminis SPM0211]